MSRSHPNWLTCQIDSIADYICRTPAGLEVLNLLARDFRMAAERIETEIAIRELSGCEYHDDGVFG